MKIKKSQLLPLFLTIKGTEGKLNLAESRIRDSFLKNLLDETKKSESEKSIIYNTFCLKNEDGTPLFVEGNKYEFPKECLDELNKEMETFYNEEVVIDVPANLKEMIEKSDYNPKIGETEIIDELLKNI